MKIRHVIRGRPQLRGLTPRRLAAAKRALRRERDRLTLFADQVAAEQPTPEKRIESFDLDLLRQDQVRRDLTAHHWRWARRQLRCHPQRATEILGKWNRSWIPATGTYFADFVRRELKARCLDIEEGGDL